MHHHAFPASILAACLSITAAAEPWTFVSAPDFLNVDVGDLTTLSATNGNNPSNASGNSTSASWESSIDTYLDAIAGESPDFVAVAGDLVMARWFQDAYFDGVFEQKFASQADRDANTTVAIERRRIENATDFYYDAWLGRFDSRGLPTYVAVGDHELGDDPSWVDPFGRQTIETYRDRFGSHFVDPVVSGTPGNGRLAAGSTLYSRPTSGQHAGTAYAIQHHNALLVTVDVFKNSGAATGNPISVTVADEQLAWLDATLRAAANDASIDHIIVQGHTPVLTPVNNRVSSSLTLDGGEDSDFWGLLQQHGADAYLAGEVHDITVTQDRAAPGLLQIAHGGILGFEQADTISYLVGTVDGPAITYDLKEIGVAVGGGQFYQPGNPTTRLKDNVTLDTATGFISVGSITVDKSSGATRFANATGAFAAVLNPALASYRFTGDAAADLTPSGQPAGVSFSDFTLVNVTQATSGEQNADRLATLNGWSVSDTFEPGAYVGFTASADNPDQALDLKRLDFLVNRANGSASHRDGRLLISGDGGQTFLTFDLFDDLITYDGRVMSSEGNSTTRFNLDLTSLNLDPAAAFEFRFQFADTDGQARTIRLDEVGLAANLVAVPEPGGFVSTGIGALILLRRRRDRSASGGYGR